MQEKLSALAAHLTEVEQQLAALKAPPLTLMPNW